MLLQARRLAGWVIMERGPTVIEDVAVQSAIKRALDPAALLNPGRGYDLAIGRCGNRATPTRRGRRSGRLWVRDRTPSTSTDARRTDETAPEVTALVDD